MNSCNRRLVALGVQSERVLALCLARVEAEHIPVTAVNSLLHFLLAVDHAALDGVHLARSVADDRATGRDKPQPRQWP